MSNVMADLFAERGGVRCAFARHRHDKGARQLASAQVPSRTVSITGVPGG